VSSDSLTLLASGLPQYVPALFFQGANITQGGQGVPFGDGLLCVQPPVQRLGIRNAYQGMARYGYAHESSMGTQVHMSVSSLGFVPIGGGARYYQVWYRDGLTFCTPPAYNLTNAVEINWIP
jgi:hypothetical protein